MLAVFDLEGTLCENEFWDGFEQTAGTAALAMGGKAGFREVMEMRFQGVQNEPREALHKAGGRIVLRKEARLVVSELARNGFEVAIASGGFDFFVERIARELGVRHWIANKLDDNPQKGFAEPLVDAAAKRNFVRQLREKLGATRQETSVIGDGANDAEMMAEAGLKIAFNAKPVLRGKADVAVDGSLEQILPILNEQKLKAQGKPRILAVGNLGIDYEQFGINAIHYKKLSRQELLEKIGGFDAFLYRGSEKLDAELLRAAHNLKLIIRPGVGIDHIDAQYCENNSIRVINTPIASTVSVAELTIGLMLSLLRHIPQADASIRRGEWGKDKYFGTQLAGKTVGIVGVGRIGRAVARRLAAFGVQIIGFDPFLHEEDFAQAGVEHVFSLEDLLARADVLTFHVPLTSDTRHMLNAANIDQVKHGALLINASRGKIIEQKAVIEALKTGILAGAAFDVYPNEPSVDNELRELDNVVLTPHLGACTQQAMERINERVLHQLKQFEANWQGGENNG